MTNDTGTGKQATCIKELEIILNDNFEQLIQISNVFAVVIGYKFQRKLQTDIPSIIVFVSAKVGENGTDNPAPKKFFSRDQTLWCYADVLQGKQSTGNDWKPKIGYRQKEFAEKKLLNSQILTSGVAIYDRKYRGTVCCLVKKRIQEESLYILTNQHVADHFDNEFFLDDKRVTSVGKSSEMKLFQDKGHYKYRIDYGLIRVASNFKGDIHNGIYYPSNFKTETIELDLSSMNLIGRKLCSVGTTQGLQYGEIVGYSYYMNSGSDGWVRSDFLIRGVNPNIEDFSNGGDSGKLLVDDFTNQPLGMLWGGNHDQLYVDLYQQEKWSFGINLNNILNVAQIRIATEEDIVQWKDHNKLNH